MKSRTSLVKGKMHLLIVHRCILKRSYNIHNLNTDRVRSQIYKTESRRNKLVLGIYNLKQEISQGIIVKKLFNI